MVFRDCTSNAHYVTPQYIRTRKLPGYCSCMTLTESIFWLLLQYVLANAVCGERRKIVSVWYICCAQPAAPVFIAVLPSAATVYIGYMLTLDCLAESKPSPTYMWTHNRSPIPGATSSKYTFSPPTKVLAGTYACTATSSGVGTIAQSTTVSVLDVGECRF